jgi:hypothetical protein
MKRKKLNDITTCNGLDVLKAVEAFTCNDLISYTLTRVRMHISFCRVGKLIIRKNKQKNIIRTFHLILSGWLGLKQEGLDGRCM